MKKLGLLKRDYRVPVTGDLTRGTDIVRKYLYFLVNDRLYTEYIPARMRDISKILDGKGYRSSFGLFRIYEHEPVKANKELENLLLEKELELCTKLITTDIEVGDKVEMIMDYAYNIDMLIEGA